MNTYHVTVRVNGTRSTWTVIARSSAKAINAVAKCLTDQYGALPSCAISAKAA